MQAALSNAGRRAMHLFLQEEIHEDKLGLRGVVGAAMHKCSAHCGIASTTAENCHLPPGKSKQIVSESNRFGSINMTIPSLRHCCADGVRRGLLQQTSGHIFLLISGDTSLRFFSSYPLYLSLSRSLSILTAGLCTHRNTGPSPRNVIAPRTSRA